MRTYDARLTELHISAGGVDRSRLAGWIECPQTAVPAPGQYVLAYSPADPFTAMSTALYCSESFSGLQPSEHGFLAAPPLPATWMPGAPLVLRGPLGHGFNLNGQRLALVALGDSAGRLLPLARQALQRGAAVTLYTDAPLPALPASMEIYPLESLSDAPGWADSLAIDLPPQALPELRHRLGLSKADRLVYPAQALVYAPMPCGGLSACGACAVSASAGLAQSRKRSERRFASRARQGHYWLACLDGPVFDLNELEW